MKKKIRPNENQEIEEAAGRGYALIEAACDLIRQQEDGPFTMMAALKEIEEAMERVHTEAALVHHMNQKLKDLSELLRKQRDEVIKQRDWLKIELDEKLNDKVNAHIHNTYRQGWEEATLAAWQQFITALLESGHPELIEQVQKLLS